MEILYQSSSVLRIALTVDNIPRDADNADDVYEVSITITRYIDGVDIVTDAQTDRESIGVYRYILDPNDDLTLGKFKVTWNYTINGEEFVKTQYYDVVVPYTSAADFRSEFEELSTKTDAQIYQKEKLARHIINTFCKQNFSFETNKTRKIEGQDVHTLPLPFRLYNLTSVSLNNSDDITDIVELFTDYHLRRINIEGEASTQGAFDNAIFKSNNYYWVTGDWGWEFVPEDIQRACNLLIKDYFLDDTMLRQHGIVQATMGDEQYYFNNDLWNTTGNYDVDILISNFANFNMVIF